MGAQLLEAFPIVPLSRNLTVVVGILSYDGMLHFGLWGDPTRAPTSRCSRAVSRTPSPNC